MPTSFRDPVVLGTFLGVLSAVAYAAAATSLRAVIDCDPVFVSFVKAVPTCGLMGVALLFYRRKSPIPWKFIVTLIVAATLMHLLGNVLFQWSLGIIGIALTVPLALGTVILAGTILGRFCLQEQVTSRMTISMSILMVSICVLSFSATDASEAMAGDIQTRVSGGSSTWTFLAVAGSCFSGFAYAIMGVVMRHGLSGKLNVAETLFTISTSGVVSLGILSYFKIGLAGIAEISGENLQMMFLAGLLTTIAFAALAKAMQLTTFIFVNALNASQVAMCSIAGVFFFDESASLMMWSGVMMTVIGLLLMRPPQLEQMRDDKLVTSTQESGLSLANEVGHD